MSSLPSLNGKVDEQYMEGMKKNYWQKKSNQSINLPSLNEEVDEKYMEIMKKKLLAAKNGAID